MAAAAGPNAGFTYGWAAADTWDMNVNWNLLDAQFMLAIISMALITPPTSPAAGDRYYIAKGSTPTGAWAGKADTVARYTAAGAWEFFTIKEGTVCRLRADNRLYHYDGGGNWLSATPQLSVQGVLTSSFGVRQIDFQQGFSATDAGSGYFQISLTGVFSTALTTTKQGSSAWPFDFSGATQSLAAASYTSVAAGSGLLMVTNHSNGDVGIFAVGGGVVKLIVSTGGTFVVGSSPAAGQIGIYYSTSSSLYTIYNNYGAAVTVTIGGMKSRASV